MTNRKSLGLLTATLALVTTIGVAQQPGGYPSSGMQPPRYNTQNPYVGSAGYRGPPLSTALPTSGPFNQGLKMPAQSSGRRPTYSGAGGYSSPFASTSLGGTRASLNAKVPTSYLGNLRVTGRSVAQVSVQRAIYGGVGW